MGCANGVKVTGKVQVDIFHRNNLSIAAAGGAAFHTKAGAEAGFSQTDQCIFADAVKAIGKAHRGGGLTLTSGCRRNRGDQNKLAVGLIF